MSIGLKGVVDITGCHLWLSRTCHDCVLVPHKMLLLLKIPDNPNESTWIVNMRVTQYQNHSMENPSQCQDYPFTTVKILVHNVSKAVCFDVFLAGKSSPFHSSSGHTDRLAWCHLHMPWDSQQGLFIHQGGREWNIQLCLYYTSGFGPLNPRLDQSVLSSESRGITLNDTLFKTNIRNWCIRAKLHAPGKLERPNGMGHRKVGVGSSLLVLNIATMQYACTKPIPEVPSESCCWNSCL